jgi:hypothetical protein
VTSQRYPRLGERRKETARTDRSCSACGSVIYHGVTCYRVDLQVSFLRGEDVVLTLCNGCNGLSTRGILKRLRGKWSSDDRGAAQEKAASEVVREEDLT